MCGSAVGGGRLPPCRSRSRGTGERPRCKGPAATLLGFICHGIAGWILMAMKMLTLREAARVLDVSIRRLRAWVTRGRLPAVRLPPRGQGPRIFIRGDDLDQWLSQHPRGAPRPVPGRRLASPKAERNAAIARAYAEGATTRELARRHGVTQAADLPAGPGLGSQGAGAQQTRLRFSGDSRESASPLARSATRCCASWWLTAGLEGPRARWSRRTRRRFWGRPSRRSRC